MKHLQRVSGPDSDLKSHLFLPQSISIVNLKLSLYVSICIGTPPFSAAQAMHLSAYVSCSNRTWFHFGDKKEGEKRERGW